MSSSEAYNRIAWEDRFQQPTVDQLLGDLPSDARKLFERLRSHLNDLSRVREEVRWCGPCWRWVVAFPYPSAPDPLAMLVPSPEDLQLVIPFDRDMLEAMPMDQMKRAIRDGLDLAREPFDTRWSVWSVQYANMLDDFTAVIDYKHMYLANRP